MMRGSNPVRVKPEVVNVGDQIEVRWESSGVTHSMTAYVGRVGMRNHRFVIVAANEHTQLVEYSGKGITSPRGAEILRHRLAPNPSPLEGLFPNA